MRGFNNELMFVRGKVISNDFWFVILLIERKLCIIIGFEKINSVSSNMLIDFIDFKNFFFWFFKILLESVDFFMFKYFFLRLNMVE